MLNKFEKPAYITRDDVEMDKFDQVDEMVCLCFKEGLALK